MKTRSRFRLTIEDEGRLENLAVVSASGLKWLTGSIVVFVLIMALGAAIAFLTPMRRLLPGYLKESERSASEMQLLRLDSLRMAFDTNNSYIENLRFVLNPSLPEKDTLSVTALSKPLSARNLLPTSNEELRFSAMMREREKYNVSVLAPLAAESMMFTPVSEMSVVAKESRKSNRAKIILSEGSTISSIADGTVIAVSQSIRDGGASVIIQHPKGFLSRLSRLGTVLVEPGDAVSGGQIIALINNDNARNGEIIYLEMWHNGNRLVPFEYIGDDPVDAVIPFSLDRDES